MKAATLKVKEFISQHLLEINSVLLGIMLCANMLVNAIGQIFEISNLFAGLTCCLGIICCFINFRRFQRDYFCLLFLIVLLLQVLLAILFFDNFASQYYLLCFLFVSIPAMLVAYHQVELNILLKTVVVCAAVTIWYPIIVMSKGAFALTPEEQMGTSYALLPVVCVGIIAVFQRELSSCLKIVICGVVAINMVAILMQMTRGTILTLAFFLFLFWLLKVCSIKQKKLRLALILLPVVAAGVLIILIPFILKTEWFYKLFIAKAGDVLNGRGEFYQKAIQWKGVIPFLIGNGSGTYSNLYPEYSMMHPHNVFLHLYYEHGILICLFVLSLFVYGITLLFKKKVDFNEKLLLVLLISLSLIKLSVSSYFWIEPSFWSYLAYIFFQFKKKKN